ncbi:hypothetical protein EBZ80_18370 [bacterium]|nr:hypothetical protein [bacterium]
MPPAKLPLFTRLYLLTTDPTLSWHAFFHSPIQGGIVVSVLVHALLYTIVLNVASYVARGRGCDGAVSRRCFFVLFFVLYLGYIARFAHARAILRALDGNHKAARGFIDQHYNSWIFLG